MAVLTDQQRAEVWAEFMRRRLCPGSILKADLRAAVNAVDDWVEANAAAFNTALPQPFRGAATAEQKAALLSYVALKRFGG